MVVIKFKKQTIRLLVNIQTGSWFSLWWGFVKAERQKYYKSQGYQLQSRTWKAPSPYIHNSHAIKYSTPVTPNFITIYCFNSYTYINIESLWQIHFFTHLRLREDMEKHFFILFREKVLLTFPISKVLFIFLNNT